MSHLNASASALVSEHLSLFLDLEITTGVLDLACGNGRNGLAVLQHHLPVTFADNNDAALSEVEEVINQSGVAGSTWLVDLEEPGTEPLAKLSFDAILVFNYLHRPLFDGIKAALRPGGLIFYETFTVKQRQFGRPSNPDFLLEPGELKAVFEGWELLHEFEGEMSNPQRAVANLIARKTH